MPSRRYVLAAEKTHLPIQTLPGLAWSRPPLDDVHLNDLRPVLETHDLIVLGGWAEPSYLLLWACARAKHKPVAFWIESTLADLDRIRWKESVKRVLLRGAAGAIVPGRKAARYCEWLGLAQERIFCAPNAVDRAYFRRRADELLPRRQLLRQELGWDGTVILFVGRMVEFFKRISVLLHAQKRLEDENLASQLVLIGEGKDRRDYERLCVQLGLRQVRFHDFVNHDALCRYYAAADVIVLPSRSETWGFVLNEAMEFGLPAVTTTTVGCSGDLVIDGENGMIVPPDDPAALADALKRLVCDPMLRARMGERCRERAVLFSPERWADGFASALDSMAG